MKCGNFGGMTVKELRKALTDLVKEGLGDYEIILEGDNALEGLRPATRPVLQHTFQTVTFAVLPTGCIREA